MAGIVKRAARHAAALLATRSPLWPIVPRGGALVLRYHRVRKCAMGSAECGIPLAVEAEEFDAQLAFLESRCQVVTAGELAASVAEGKPLPQNAVAITFDDGYADNHSLALPLLARHGLRAAFFVTAGWIGTEKVLWWDRIHDYVRQAAELGAQPLDYAELPRPVAAALAAADLRTAAGAARLEHELVKAMSSLPLTPEAADNLAERIAASLGADVAAPEPYRPMTWNQVRDLKAAGMEVGAHSMSHARLVHVPPERAYEELAQSKQLIEKELGAEVPLLAYPAGNHNQDVVDLAREAGYAAAFTTASGAVRPGSDPFRLPRVGVGAGGYRGTLSLFSSAVFGLQLGRLARRREE